MAERSASEHFVDIRFNSWCQLCQLFKEQSWPPTSITPDWTNRRRPDEDKKNSTDEGLARGSCQFAEIVGLRNTKMKAELVAEIFGFCSQYIIASIELVAEKVVTDSDFDQNSYISFMKTENKSAAKLEGYVI